MKQELHVAARLPLASAMSKYDQLSALCPQHCAQTTGAGGEVLTTPAPGFEVLSDG